jgi:hypothetical protein
VTKSPNVFEDPSVVDAYADRVARNVPAYRDIHRMAAVLIDDAPPGPFDYLNLETDARCVLALEVTVHHGVLPTAQQIEKTGRNLLSSRGSP